MNRVMIVSSSNAMNDPLYLTAGAAARAISQFDGTFNENYQYEISAVYDNTRKIAGYQARVKDENGFGVGYLVYRDDNLPAGMVRRGLTIVAKAGESEWVIFDTRHGDIEAKIKKGREFWAHRVGTGEVPGHLKGVAGFYASSLAEVEYKLKNG